MKEKRPLEFRNVVISPGKDFLGLSLFLKEDKPGILRKVTEIIDNLGLNINYIYGYTADGGPRIVIVLDTTDTDVDYENLKEMILREIKAVSKIERFEPWTPGLIVDTTSFPLTIFGSRILMMRKEGIEELLRGLRDELSPDTASLILYHVGTRMGKGLSLTHKWIASELGIDDPREILLKISLPLFQSLGYGLADIEFVDENIIINKYDCIECVSLKELVEHEHTVDEEGTDVGCNLVRGIIEGAISNIFNKNYESRETKCIARGDEYCELILKPRGRG